MDMGVGIKLEGIVHKAAKPFVIAGASAYLMLNLIGCSGNTTPTPNPANNPSPKPSPTATYTPEPTPTSVPTPTATPAPDNPYDFAKSSGLEAAYLKDIAFDDSSKGLISYFASLPSQMRSIAERSGLLEDILNDKQVDAKEAVFFNRVIDSYKKEIETFKPWLSQLPENEVTAALALNLSNFREAGYLKNEKMPSLLSPAIFFADGVKRMYIDEIMDPVGWRDKPSKAYTSAMVENVNNFSEIQKKAWEVVNSPDARYNGRSIEEILHRGHFQAEAVGSTDKGQNAYEDINLLLKSGSPEAKAALRIYARNLTREGRQGSAEQVRVELTEIDLWSIGIPSYLVVLRGHDVPTIPLTLDDIALLKSRSADPLFILDIDGKYHLPFQWTRTSIIRQDVTHFTIPDGIGRKGIKIADLKPY